LAAALLHPFAKCVGIELLEGLFNMSLRIHDQYSAQKEEISREFPGLYPQSDQLPEIEFIQGSFFDIDWPDASLILANSTCFSFAMMQKIASRPVPPNTFAITLSKPIAGGNWELLDSFRRPMSWGEATVLLHRRVG